MGIIAPLFLAGLAGLALPLILHLVRRTPKGKQQFSSLMFLSPTPPRLTRRSRLDQVLLLLLRLGALALLAFAFARPFFRENSILAITDLQQRRVAILLDTSASMRRGDLWKQALQTAEKELVDLAPHDEVALYTFADRLQTVVSFASPDEATSAAPADVVRQALKKLQPGWAAGDMGTAITSLATELDSANDVAQSQAVPQLIVISDFQKGNRVDALQGFEWPQDVRVVPRPLTLKQTSNATLQFLAAEGETPEDELRVRVSNAADSSQDQFFVRWFNTKEPNATAGEVAVYVPPSQSRVVRLPRAMNNLLADRVVLRGDAQDFDNAFYVVPPRQQQISLVYLGNDAADDPQGLQYYLRLATADDPLRQVEIKAIANDAPLPNDVLPQVVVASTALTSDQQTQIKSFVEKGGALILVPGDHASASSLSAFFADLELLPAKPNRNEKEFQLLGEIDFSNPLFQPFANPRYNDFTRIHFWQHRAIKLPAESKSHVLARFDNGDPWLIETSLGKGHVWAFTSGWQPDDSQLAVSSKFLPLIGNLLDQACGASRALASTVVNAAVALPRERQAELQIQTPSGSKLKVAAGAADFRETAEPGIYRATGDQQEFRFAVNVAASESDTAPLAIEQLEQLGLKIGQTATQAERLHRERQRRDTELESRQQFWRWLMVGCLSLLILETWWAARASQAARTPAAQAPTEAVA
jgi:hypothetical protein